MVRRRTYRRRSSVRRRAPVRRRTTRRRTLRSGGVVYQRRQPQPCKCPGELSPSQKFMLAQLDPFDVKCNGAKIPDSNMIPSISNVDTDIVGFSGPQGTDTVRAIAFRPGYRSGEVIATAGSGSVSWGASLSSNVVNRDKTTTYEAQIELFRPVADAIRMTSPLAPTSATGFVHIGLSTESRYNEGTWTFPTTVTQMANLQFYKRVTLASLTQTPFTVINKWLDDTAFRYSSPAAPPGNAGQSEFQTDLAWATIVVMLEGTQQAGVALSFEHLLISEGIPQRDGVFIGSAAAPNAPDIISAVSSAQSRTEPFHTEAEQESYINQGLNAMADGAMAAGEGVYYNVALPLLRQAGYRAVTTGLAMAANALGGRGGIPGVNANPARLEM